MKRSVKVTFSSFTAIAVAVLLLYFSPVDVADNRPLENLLYKACPLVAFAVGFLVYQLVNLFEDD